MNELLLRLTSEMPMKQINLVSVVRNEIVVGCTELAEETSEHHAPYLQRYYAGTFRDGRDLWLHRFLSNDGDRNLHSHPFNFITIMLNGGYTEEFADPNDYKIFRTTEPDYNSQLPELLEGILSQLKINERHLRPDIWKFISAANSIRRVDVFDWHRIASIQDQTWTAVIVEPERLPKWFFKDGEGELTDVIASPREWWNDYKVRPESGIAIDDNRN